MSEFIEALDLRKEYHKQEAGIAALNGVTFTARQGDFVGLVGRSGSGKSTLLNLIGGLDSATSGQLLIQGRDLAAMDRRELALHRRRTVGMIFQSFNLIPSRTALDNVVLPMIFAGRPRAERLERGAALLDLVGLTPRQRHKPAELSGGEAQRVAIARALANEPLLLLADEPTGNLDSHTAAGILDLLQKLNAEHGLTVIMVTHDQLSAGRLAHRLLQLLDGEIVAQDELRRRP